MGSDQHPQSDMTIGLTDNNMLPMLKEIASLVTHAAQAANLEMVLERIAKVSAKLVNARYAALGIPDGRGGLRYFKVTGISDEERRKIPHLPRGYGLLGVIMNERQVVRLAHMGQDPRSSGFPEGHPDMRSLLGVPVMMGDQLYGMLYLTDRKDGQLFSEQDQYIIEVMASYAALAIANSQLQEQRSRLTVLEERERIMMELHDGVIQSIYAIGMQVDLISNTSRDVEQLANLRRVIGDLNTVIEDIRRYIQNLRTINEDERASFYDCVEELLHRIYTPAKLKIEIDVPRDLNPPISGTAFEAVCQIVHEALSNVVRHANATQAIIHATIQNDMFTILIEDNGSGFDITMRDAAGLGLRNIQQRARIHGGEIEIDSALGEGTRVTINVPLKPY